MHSLVDSNGDNPENCGRFLVASLSMHVLQHCNAFQSCTLHHSWWQGCRAEEERAAAEAEAAAAAREATPEVSEEGEIAVDPEELEEISKAQQQAASKQAHPHSPAPKQASDRGRDRERDRGLDRDKGHPGRDRQVPFLCWCSLHPSLSTCLMASVTPSCLTPHSCLWSFA